MKNAIIAGVVGLLFMGGGFMAGLKYMPKPAAKVAAAPAPTEVKLPGNAVATPVPDAISLDTLKKTSESMMGLNQQLALREQRVAQREQKAIQREDEIAAERTALDASHDKFKHLFGEFKNRLQLVEDSEREQLTKQAELYDAMGPDQSVEMIRSMDDSTVTRLFSVMDTKPLAKLVSQWKTKYPADSMRLLAALNATATVLPKDKIALSDPSLNEAPLPAPPAPEAPAPAPGPEAPQVPATAPDAASPDGSTPDATVPPAPPQLTPPADAPTASKPATAEATRQPADAVVSAAPAPSALPPAAADMSSPGAAAEAAQTIATPVTAAAEASAAPAVTPATPVLPPGAEDTLPQNAPNKAVKVTSNNLD